MESLKRYRIGLPSNTDSLTLHHLASPGMFWHDLVTEKWILVCENEAALHNAIILPPTSRIGSGLEL